MPTKRRLLKERAHRVTDAAVVAFEADDWLGLHRALGLRPWQPGPLDVDDRETPEWAGRSAWAAAWPLAVELRAELNRAARG